MNLPYGGNHDPVTLQPGPSSMRLFQCPECKRVGRARLKPKCHGGERSPHRGVMTQPVEEKLAAAINANDPPVYT